MGESEPRGTLGTVRNAALLLDLLSQGAARQTLTELADRSGLTLPTVHRLLRSLVVAGLADQDPVSSRYGLGPELARLSHSYLDRLPVLRALSPYLVGLRDQVAATVEVAVLSRAQVVYVERVDGPGGALYRDSHRVLPALSTAAGRLLVARADDATWELALGDAPADQRPDLAGRRRAWAGAEHLVTGDGAGRAAAELAVPVLDGRGDTPAALTVELAAGDGEHAPPQMLAQLRRTARAAGRAVGNG